MIWPMHAHTRTRIFPVTLTIYIEHDYNDQLCLQLEDQGSSALYAFYLPLFLISSSY